MKTLLNLKDVLSKPISLEALARCLESTNMPPILREANTAKRLRKQKPFDVAIISSVIVEEMEIVFFRYKGEVPLYTTYCGHAVQKILEKLGYSDLEFPSSIKIK